MIETKLKEIKSRFEAATEGPWVGRRQTNKYEVPFVYQTNHVTRDVWNIPKTNDDADFIAHARTDVPMSLEMVHDLLIKIKLGNNDKCVELAKEDLEKIVEKYNE